MHLFEKAHVPTGIQMQCIRMRLYACGGRSMQIPCTQGGCFTPSNKWHRLTHDTCEQHLVNQEILFFVSMQPSGSPKTLLRFLTALCQTGLEDTTRLFLNNPWEEAFATISFVRFFSWVQLGATYLDAMMMSGVVLQVVSLFCLANCVRACVRAYV